MDTGDRLPFEFLHALDELEKYGLPEEIDKFHMETYICKFNECATTACFAGCISYFIPKYEERWGDYTDRIIGVSSKITGVWTWLFSYEWTGIDNTLEGATARARYYNEYGVPENWEKQIKGKAPLCYKVKDKISIKEAVI